MKITAQEIAFYSPNSDILSRVESQRTPSTPNSSQAFAALDKVSLSRESSPAGTSRGVNIDEFATMITRNFWKAQDVDKNAGEHRELFWQISNSLMDEGDLQIAFHDFAASLSKKDLKHFLSVLKKNPENLSNIMDTASRLSKKALIPFLEAASLAGSDFDEFNQHVNQLLDQKGTSSSAFQYTYLSAVVKTGPQTMEFIENSNKMSEQEWKKLATFINREISGDDRENFIEFFSFASQENLDTLIDVASGLNKKDKSNLLAAASWAENHTETFMGSVTKNKGKSEFFTVAAHSEKRLGTFLQLANQLDLKVTSSFSAVDTANFLDAAKKSNDHIRKLTQVSEQMEGEDKSYLLYAAANANVDLDNFLAKALELTETERSNFLIETTYQDEDPLDQAVYMKSLLTEGEYNDFQNTTKGLQKDMLGQLVEMTSKFTGQLRSDFLEAGAASDQAAGDFILMFGDLSETDQKSYLNVAMELTGERQKKFVQTSVRTMGSLSKFVEITRELLDHSTKHMGSMRPLDNFLSLAQGATSNDLLDFVHLVDQLDDKQRRGFLNTATKSTIELSEMVKLVKSALHLKPERFNDIFNFNTFNHYDKKYNPSGTKVSINDYKSLIGLAGQLKDSEWTNFKGIQNQFKISLSELTFMAKNVESFEPEKYGHDYFISIGVSDGTTDIVV